MQEPLITFETGTLAKDKGFNGPTTHYYVRKYGVHFKDHKTPLNCNNGEDDGESKLLQLRVFRDGQPHLVAAVPQSVLQTWLRDVHNIDIVITPKFKDLGKFYGCVISTEEFSLNLGSNFASYEEALEKALVKGLNKL